MDSVGICLGADSSSQHDAGNARTERFGSRDLHRVFWGLTLVYGGGWFIPALLISDFFLMWRGLSWGDLKRYALLTAITALVIGLALSGMMLMVGYPLTAVSILVLGFLLRKRPQVSSKI